MNIRIIIVPVIMLCLAITTGHAKDNDPSAAEGKTIFQAQCASCHNVNKQLIGPALAGVDQRHTEAWIIQFIRASQAMVKSGDKEAVALFTQFKIPMPDHPDLSDTQIRSILSYIKSAAVAEAADKPPFNRPAVIQPGYQPFSPGSPALWAYLLLTAVLIIVLLFAVKVKDLQKERSGDDNENVP